MSGGQEVFPGWEGIFAARGGEKPGPAQAGGLEALIMDGLSDPSGRRLAKPARHVSSLLNQIAFSPLRKIESFDSLLSPFVREDGLSFGELKQALQGLAFAIFYRSLNTAATENGMDCLKIRLDLVCPEQLRERKAVVGGRKLPYTYGSLSGEAGEVCRALQELLDEGNAEGEPFGCLSVLCGGESSGWEEGLPQDISYELFTMKQCKKCAAVRDFMALSRLRGEEIDVDRDKGFDRASEAGVFVTPTVIFYNGAREEIARAHNVQELESVLILLKDRG